MRNNYKKNKRESVFFDRIKKMGVEIVPFEGAFRLSGNVSYSPDFYLPQMNTYVEVVGTKQAFALNKFKYLEMMLMNCVNIWFVTPDFKSLHPYLFEKVFGKNKKCAVVDCTNMRTYAKRDDPYCSRHSKRLRTTGYLHTDKKIILCAHDNCNGRVQAKGFCGEHYYQFKKEAGPPCRTEGCGKHAIVAGFCATCYQRNRKLQHEIEHRKGTK